MHVPGHLFEFYMDDVHERLRLLRGFLSQALGPGSLILVRHEIVFSHIHYCSDD